MTLTPGHIRLQLQLRLRRSAIGPSGCSCRHRSADVVVQMIHRAASPGLSCGGKGPKGAGFCANPIHLIGTDRYGRQHRVLSRCNNRRAVACPACSDLYARDTWQLIHAGLHGGHHDLPTTRR